jgi:hypothetical protein
VPLTGKFFPLVFKQYEIHMCVGIIATRYITQRI